MDWCLWESPPTSCQVQAQMFFGRRGNFKTSGYSSISPPCHAASFQHQFCFLQSCFLVPLLANQDGTMPSKRFWLLLGDPETAFVESWYNFFHPLGMHSPEIGLNLNTPKSSRSVYSLNHFPDSKLHKRLWRDLHPMRTWFQAPVVASACGQEEFSLLNLFLQSSELLVI